MSLTTIFSSIVSNKNVVAPIIQTLESNASLEFRATLKFHYLDSVIGSLQII